MSSSNTTRLFVHVFEPSMTKEERFELIIESFGPFCQLTEENIILIKDKAFGGYKNYCFVEVDSESAEKIMEEFSKPTEDGLQWSISIAKPKEEGDTSGDRRSGGGGYNNGGSQGGGRGYNNNNAGGYNSKRY